MFDRRLVKNVNYRLPADSPAHVLSKALENGYLQQRREESIVTKTSFAPSSIGIGSGRCPRRWYLAFAGKHESTENGDAMGVATLQHGTMAHERIQRALEASGAKVENEIEINYDNPPIRAFVDTVIELENKQYVIEIKTMGMEKFSLREAQMKGLDQHYYQILIYMYILDIDQGFLLYENRNDLSLITIPVIMDQRNRKVVEDALDWLRSIHKVTQGSELPKRPFRKSSNICKYCPLKDACWNELPEGILQIDPMEVNSRW